MPFTSCLQHVYAVYTMFIPSFMWCLYYIYTSWFYHDYRIIKPCSYSVYTMNIPCLYRVCTMLIPCLHHGYQHVYSIPYLCHAYTKLKHWLYYVFTDTWYMFIVYHVFTMCLYHVYTHYYPMDVPSSTSCTSALVSHRHQQSQWCWWQRHVPRLRSVETAMRRRPATVPRCAKPQGPHAMGAQKILGSLGLQIFHTVGNWANWLSGYNSV